MMVLVGLLGHLKKLLHLLHEVLVFVFGCIPWQGNPAAAANRISYFRGKGMRQREAEKNEMGKVCLQTPKNGQGFSKSSPQDWMRRPSLWPTL
jgi:hypothetical protein